MKNRILSAINKYAKANAVRLHMPGHKANKDFCKAFPFAQSDVTELDVIKNEEVRLKAEQDCANLLGAKYLRFTTDGATSLVLSSVYAVKGYGSKLIIARNSHKSVFNALKICNIEPIIIDTKIVNGLVTQPTKEQVEKALNDNDNVIGALLTYPDYYGNVFDIQAISNLLKERGKLFIIDNSHGGHFRYFKGLNSASDYADICIESAHKVNPTLTQGAYVVCQNDRLVDLLKSATDIFFTTSPSYPILASIEYGIKKMHSLATKLQRVEAWVKELKSKVKSLGYNVVENDDPFKLSIDFLSVGISTTKAEKILAKENIFAEMNDGRRLLFLFSLSSEKEHFNRLYSALKGILRQANLGSKKAKEISHDIGEKVLNYTTAVNVKESDSKYVEIDKAVGKVALENAGIFPPCYPIIIAGEQITKQNANLLAKAKFTFGLKDKTIKVLK